MRRAKLRSERMPADAGGERRCDCNIHIYTVYIDLEGPSNSHFKKYGYCSDSRVIPTASLCLTREYRKHNRSRAKIGVIFAQALEEQKQQKATYMPGCFATVRESALTIARERGGLVRGRRTDGWIREHSDGRESDKGGSGAEPGLALRGYTGV